MIQGMETEFAIGTFGAVAGIVVAVVLFSLGWWLVRRARKGNAKVRAAHHDPHQATVGRRRGPDRDPDDPQRNIPQ